MNSSAWAVAWHSLFGATTLLTYIVLIVLAGQYVDMPDSKAFAMLPMVGLPFVLGGLVAALPRWHINESLIAGVLFIAASALILGLMALKVIPLEPPPVNLILTIMISQTCVAAIFAGGGLLMLKLKSSISRRPA